MRHDQRSSAVPRPDVSTDRTEYSSIRVAKFCSIYQLVAYFSSPAGFSVPRTLRLASYWHSVLQYLL